MEGEERELFWRIVNCPLRTGPSPECTRVTGQQNDRPQRMIPEPWSGNLRTASMLVIGVIPSLPRNEVFPTRSATIPHDWGQRCAQSGTWTDAEVEAFFENRFCGGTCPTCGQMYYDVEARTTLHRSGTGCFSTRARNDYWGVYDTYCSAIADVWRNKEMVPRNFSTSYAFTDVVHCKGKHEIGVRRAAHVCSEYLHGIVSLFVRNEAPRHALLIVGKNNWKDYINSALGLNLTIEGPAIQNPGRYLMRKQEIQTENFVLQTNVLFENNPVEVYYNIPAPSKSNLACRPVTFYDRTITW